MTGFLNLDKPEPKMIFHHKDTKDTEKNWLLSIDDKRAMIEPGHPEISIRRQCELVGLNRASYYYTPASESPLNLELMRWADKAEKFKKVYWSR